MEEKVEREPIPTPDWLFPDGIFEKGCTMSQGVIASLYEETQTSYMNLVFNLGYLPTMIARLEQDYEEAKELQDTNPAFQQKVQSLATMIREKKRELSRFTQEISYYRQKANALAGMMSDVTREILLWERHY